MTASDCECVCVFVTVLVFVKYQDTNVYNDIGMTQVSYYKERVKYEDIGHVPTFHKNKRVCV